MAMVKIMVLGVLTVFCALCIFFGPALIGMMLWLSFVWVFRLDPYDSVDIKSNMPSLFGNTAMYALISGVVFIVLFIIVEPHIYLPPARWEALPLCVVQFLSGIWGTRAWMLKRSTESRETDLSPPVSSRTELALVARNIVGVRPLEGRNIELTLPVAVRVFEQKIDESESVSLMSFLIPKGEKIVFDSMSHACWGGQYQYFLSYRDENDRRRYVLVDDLELPPDARDALEMRFCSYSLPAVK